MSKCASLRSARVSACNWKAALLTRMLSCPQLLHDVLDCIRAEPRVAAPRSVRLLPHKACRKAHPGSRTDLLFWGMGTGSAKLHLYASGSACVKGSCLRCSSPLC